VIDINDNKGIINMCSFDWKNTPTVKISVDGKGCDAMTDLITGETFTGTVLLEPFMPRLLRVE